MLDSLRYWAVEMHVDGFRFDLASIFTRNADGTLNLDDPPIISEITSDPALMHKRLIAEAWTLPFMSWGGSFRASLGSNGMADFAMTFARLSGEIRDL